MQAFGAIGMTFFNFEMIFGRTGFQYFLGVIGVAENASKIECQGARNHGGGGLRAGLRPKTLGALGPNICID